MGDPDCGECGAEDVGWNWVACCQAYMCDFCADKHDAKYGTQEEDDTT